MPGCKGNHIHSLFLTDSQGRLKCWWKSTKSTLHFCYGVLPEIADQNESMVNVSKTELFVTSAKFQYQRSKRWTAKHVPSATIS